MISVAKIVLWSTTTVPPPLKRLMTSIPAALATSVWMSSSFFLQTSQEALGLKKRAAGIQDAV